MVNEAEHILVNKLDEFIRRYYKNLLIKGILYSSAILLAAFLGVIFLEYLAQFNSLIRGVLFFGFIGSALFVLIRFILIPLLKLNRIGERISYLQAADIIGKHFNSVQDKLLNVLQLQNYHMQGASDELLLAGINQKITELKPVPFTAAINLNENRRYLPYVGSLVLLTLMIAVIWPHIISKSTTRLINYQTYYEKEMPFHFSIANPSLKAMQTADFDLKIKVNGKEIPNEVYLIVKGIEYKMEKDNTVDFHYTFTNLQNNQLFQFSAAGFLSKEYELEVLPKPSLLKFNLQLTYPAYLHREPEMLDNTGDLQVPQGTKVNWSFSTKNTDHLALVFSDTLVFPEENDENSFVYSRKFLRNNRYTIKASNQHVPESPDSVSYFVNVIADQFPLIDVSEKKDSLNLLNIYFSGEMKDDYGFSGLRFRYKKFSRDTNGRSVEEQGMVPVSFKKDQITQAYFYYLNLAEYALTSGDRLEYYFEVTDNDAVNGPKSSHTRFMEFKAPDRDELQEATEKNNSDIKKDLEESIKKAKDLQKEVNEISKRLSEKNQPAYEDKKKINDLLKKQEDLQRKIEELKRANEENNKQQNQFSETEESILEKQKQLEQLFENIMTPEMKKLFEELNQMLDKMDKNQVQEKLDELKLTNKDIEKELDRNLEAFKQLELEQKMQFALDKLDELQKKEEELAKETEGKKDNAEKDKNAKEENKDKKNTEQNLKQKQDELNKAFEQLKKDLQDIDQKNKELEEPNEIPDTKQLEEEISNQMQNSSKQLSQKNKKEAAESQKSAAEKMEEMKEAMENAMMEEEEEKEGENAQSLRQILDNLLRLSYGQEDLIKVLPSTRIDNPQYVNIPKQQNKLKEDSRQIEDSLLALSKRAPQISALVNREISSIHQNMDKTVKALAERNTGESAMRMQSTMTSVNNLALLLNESLEQMQQQMKSKKENKGEKGGKCKKPGSGTGQKPSKSGSAVTNMRKMQEQLNRQLQEMKEAMERGQKPGEKPGDKSGNKPGLGNRSGGQNGLGMPGSSEQFARMAAQQEALRRQMQGLMDKMKNKGQGPGGDVASLMEETEKDLVNKQLTQATMKRQQEILTRLLESEKADMERELDEERKSNEAKNQKISNPDEFNEYKRLKEKEMELLNTVPPSLTPYYKQKVERFFNNLER